jgi:hypothetical protein
VRKRLIIFCVSIPLGACILLVSARAGIAAITFSVCDVAPATKALMTVDLHNAMERSAGKFEASAHRERPLVPVPTYANPLLQAAQLSFSMHCPLVLSPEIVWLAICQGFASHVDQNAETLRYRIVAHDGEKTIKVRRHDFRMGDPNDPWQEVFPAFCDSMKAYLVTDLHSVLLPSFSTSRVIDKAAFEIAFMDVLDSYFEYSYFEDSLIVERGVPEITLEGTAEDWRLVREHAQQLRDFDLQWWIDPLTPVLDQFIASAEGQPDTDFWSGIYNRENMSGKSQVSGWILRLFPYVTDTPGKLRRNPFLDRDPGPTEGIWIEAFPSGMTKVDFKFIDRTNVIERVRPMQWMGGFVGISQDPTTLQLLPDIGWNVRDDPDEK